MDPLSCKKYRTNIGIIVSKNIIFENVIAPIISTHVVLITFHDFLIAKSVLSSSQAIAGNAKKMNTLSPFKSVLNIEDPPFQLNPPPIC